MSTPSISARVFYLIRYHDVELAEDFARRCPHNAQTVKEINQFFHLLLTQYPLDTHAHALRQGLLECTDFDQWAVSFVAQVLPELQRRRLPPCTHLHQPSVYESRLPRLRAAS